MEDDPTEASTAGPTKLSRKSRIFTEFMLRPINYDSFSVLTTSGQELAMLIEHSAKHKDCADLRGRLMPCMNGALEFGRLEISDRDQVNAWYDLFATVGHHQRELFLPTRSKAELLVWRDLAHPFRWPSIDGPYAAIQRYITWKEANDGKATYDEWKEYVEPYRNKRQPHDMEEPAGHCASSMASHHVPPFPVHKQDIEQVAGNPTQVVFVRVRWIRGILFSAGKEHEEKLGLDIGDLEKRVIPDDPTILMSDKEVPITLAQKMEIEALWKALEWLREMGIVKPPGYLIDHERGYWRLVDMGKMKDNLDAYVAAVEAERSAQQPPNTWLHASVPAESDAAAAEAISQLNLQ